MFRFTLGIPGFEDEDIPRVVGLVGAALLVANHVLMPAVLTPSDAQVKAPPVRNLPCHFYIRHRRNRTRGHPSAWFVGRDTARLA